MGKEAEEVGTDSTNEKPAKDVVEESKTKAKEVLDQDIQDLLDAADTFPQRLEIYLTQILIALKPK